MDYPLLLIVIESTFESWHFVSKWQRWSETFQRLTQVVKNTTGEILKSQWWRKWHVSPSSFKFHALNVWLDLPTANAIEKSYMAPPRECRPLCADLLRLLRGTFEGRRDLALRVIMSQPGTCATNCFWNSHLIKVFTIKSSDGSSFKTEFDNISCYELR